MLKVWGRRTSFNVQKVLWFIGELGLEFEHISAGGNFGRLDEPGFRAMNPHGRVPVLEDGDAAIWESQTILRYLAARYGEGRFWQDDPVQRATVEHGLGAARMVAGVDPTLATFGATLGAEAAQLLDVRRADRHLDEMQRTGGESVCVAVSLGFHAVSASAMSSAPSSTRSPTA